jgi:hypothetical protein
MNNEENIDAPRTFDEAMDLAHKCVESKNIPKDEKCCKNCRHYGASTFYAGEGHCYKSGDDRVEARPWEVCDDFEEGPSDIVSGNAPTGTLAIKMYGGYGCGKSFLLDILAWELRKLDDIQMVSVDHNEHIMIIQADDGSDKEKEWCEKTGQDSEEFIKRCKREEKMMGLPSRKPDFPDDVKAVIKKLKGDMA